ncbi:MAG: tRNA (adenosine(37)-N6)-threonylcarbamoyltransferase complex dimerization subunit type 1 TsaB [Anaplasma sp.]
MKIMGIDASGPQCAVSVFDVEQQHFFEAESAEKNSLAESLFALIDSALASSRSTHLDVTHIVVTVGPGSFTGLRASLAAVQGFRLTTNIAIHGVNLLELQAYLLSKHNPEGKNIVSVVNMSKGEKVYYQMFDSSLLPITEIDLTESCSVPRGGCIASCCYQLPDLTRARVAAEYLVHKLSRGLPETPLSPIYSRAYFETSCA